MSSSPKLLSPLSMSDLPPIYILTTHLDQEQVHRAEDALYQVGGRLTYCASEARIFLGKVLHKKRAAFDLRAGGVWTKEEPLPTGLLDGITQEQRSKRRKLDRGRVEEVKSSSDTEYDDEGEIKVTGSKHSRPTDTTSASFAEHIVVLKLEWLDACNNSGQIPPFEPYLIYSGKIVAKPDGESTSPPSTQPKDSITYVKAIPESRLRTSLNDSATSNTAAIIERAKADNTSPNSSSVPFHRRKFGQRTSPATGSKTNPPKLHRTTTSEHDYVNSSSTVSIPPTPAWVNEPHPRPIYSCLRDTPPLETNPNRYFIRQLEKVKETRQLTMDEIGVRAYSTSIASLAAYPHRIVSPREITRLPGCSDKIAALWTEWHRSVTSSSDIQSITIATQDEQGEGREDDSNLDPYRTIPSSHLHQMIPESDLPTLLHFHSIWGVGAETARKFFYNHGWRDTDDIVEHGWSTQLTRSQQIGLKFHDEFQLPIPRSEVESIARHVLHHARKVRHVPPEYHTNDVVAGRNSSTADCVGDPRDFVCAIVGGYRRGKDESGDVDVIISHRDDRFTKGLILDLVHSLEGSVADVNADAARKGKKRGEGQGFITHTLTIHTSTSGREEQTLPYRSDAGPGVRRGGFDSLDKALVVWRFPGDPSNPHRRVDIIVSPWRTIGCAVLGWSGGTTFQRDIRRWAKRERGWKFDSSGVRTRGSGTVLDLESVRGDNGAGGGGEGKGVEENEGDGWEDHERRVMERLGIGWREARLRCTG